ncbi:MAG: hypothetical protein ACREIC_08985 [Limisphaerales bacterium]
MRRFNASFLELAVVYGLSAYGFGELCVFGGTWHNASATVLSFIAAVYCSTRVMECLAAWIGMKWRESVAAPPAELVTPAVPEQVEPPVVYVHQRRTFAARRPVLHGERAVLR